MMGRDGSSFCGHSIESITVSNRDPNNDNKFKSMVIDVPEIASKHTASIGQAVLHSINNINKIRKDLFDNASDLNAQLPNHMSDSIGTEQAVSRWLQTRADTPVSVINYQCTQHVLAAAADGVSSKLNDRRNNSSNDKGIDSENIKNTNKNNTNNMSNTNYNAGALKFIEFCCKQVYPNSSSVNNVATSFRNYCINNNTQYYMNHLPK